MNCPYCGNEIIYEDATFCPKCGKSLEPADELPKKRTDLVLVAAILAIISAAFVASIGYIGVYQYNSLIGYYGSSRASEFFGFLVFGITDIIGALLALVGGIYMLERKHLKISVLGVIFLLVSVLVNYIIIVHYNYGFADILLFSEVTVLIFSILSGILVFTSKAEFT